MLHEMKTMIKITGKATSFLLLLLLRCPFDAVRTVVTALFLQYSFEAIAQSNTNQLFIICIAYGIANVLLFLYNGTIWIRYAAFVTRMESILRIKLAKKIASLSYEQIEARPEGDFATLLNTDVQLPFSRPLHLPHALCAIVNISASAVILWLMNPKVLGLVLLFAIPHILFTQFLMARPMADLKKESLKANALNTGELGTFITCADTAAIYDAQDYLMKRFEDSSLKLVKANMKIQRRQAANNAILPLFGLGGYVTLLIVCGTWIANGSTTFGELTAAFQYRGGVIAGSCMLINCILSIRSSMAGIKRINQVLEESQVPHQAQTTSIPILKKHNVHKIRKIGG
ncbi:MAG: ABC transporter ATP-binding protein [Lachnospiraceae bacterium]|nr:ABC transporter ATP-binding protein [Lachnospiraceae bacterium]